MWEVPLWAIAAAGTFMTCNLAVLGYLLKSMLASIRTQAEDAKKDIKEHVDSTRRSIDKIRSELAAVDKRFLEEQLAQGGKFVDKEGFTRDYVTLTQRIDGLHKRTDRAEREVAAMAGSRSIRPRSPSDGGFKPPKGS